MLTAKNIITSLFHTLPSGWRPPKPKPKGTPPKPKPPPTPPTPPTQSFSLFSYDIIDYHNHF